MDIDLDLCEAELDAEVQNLRLLRKQMQSIQSIKTELRKKDTLIATLKSKVISLETRLLSSEEEVEKLTAQLNTTLHFHEADTIARISNLQQQLKGLQQKIVDLQDARDMEQIALSDTVQAAETHRAKYIKYRDLYNEQKAVNEKTISELQRKFLELETREARWQEESSLQAERAEELQVHLQRKSDELQTAISTYTMEIAEAALRNANDMMGLQEELSRLRTANVEYEVKARSWKHAAEVATDHEKDTTTRLQDGLKRFQSEIEGCNKSHESELALKDEEILRLQRALDAATKETAEIRKVLATERENWNEERRTLVTGKIPQLQKEIGALQMGVCLQKEMKDEAQSHVKLLKACLQSLSTDLASTMESASEETIYNRCVRLCGVFDRLLTAAAAKSKKAARAMAEGATSGLTIDVEEASSSGTEEYLRLSPTKSSTAAFQGIPKSSRPKHESVSIDPEFYAVIRSLRDLLIKIAQDQVALIATNASNDATKAETSILNDEINHLRSDLDDCDEFLLSLTRLFAEAGFVGLDGLESSPSSRSVIAMKSAKHRRAVCFAKTKAGANEAIRLVDSLRQELTDERDGANKSKHTIIAMLKEIGHDSEPEDSKVDRNFHRAESMRSPASNSNGVAISVDFGPDDASPVTRSSFRRAPTPTSNSKRAGGRNNARASPLASSPKLNSEPDFI